MERVIIFGAAKVGLEVKKQLEAEGKQIIAFSDNDPNKWGTLFEQIRVIKPSEILSHSFEVIAIGNFKAAPMIKNQLIEYGILESKIIVPIQPVRIFPNIYQKKIETTKKNIIIIYGNSFSGFRDYADNRGIVLDIDYKNNYWAFFYFIKQYLDNGDNIWKSYTEEENDIFCKLDGLSITIIVSSDRKYIEEIQSWIQQNGIYAFSVESSWLDKVIRYKSDFEFWKYRYPREINERLLSKINELKGEMRKNFIAEDEFCVVGSTILQLYGITETEDRDDVDIILTKELRKLYGETLIIVSEHVEIHAKDQYDIMDDEIVKNPNYHFWCFGIKFMSLDVFYRNRKRKGVSDTKLIEYFYKNQIDED